MSQLRKRYVLPPGPNGTPVFGNTISAWCPVCGGPTVEVYKLAVIDLMERFAVTCHGSTEYRNFSIPALEATPRHEVPRAVELWLRTVFESDTQPDVMLSIKYGMGQTMKEPA